MSLAPVGWFSAIRPSNSARAGNQATQRFMALNLRFFLLGAKNTRGSRYSMVASPSSLSKGRSSANQLIMPPTRFAVSNPRSWRKVAARNERPPDRHAQMMSRSRGSSSRWSGSSESGMSDAIGAWPASHSPSCRTSRRIASPSSSSNASLGLTSRTDIAQPLAFFVAISTTPRMYLERASEASQRLRLRRRGGRTKRVNPDRWP